MEAYSADVERKMKRFFDWLSEKDRRRYAAVEAAKLGHGAGYKYAHDFEGGYVAQDYLGVDKTYYSPTDRGYEAKIAAHMEQLKRIAEQPSAEKNEPPASPD